MNRRRAGPGAAPVRLSVPSGYGQLAMAGWPGLMRSYPGIALEVF